MSERKKSKEERFLFKAFELTGGVVDLEVDRYKVGKLIGENPKSIDNVVQLLTKNGLTRKGEGSLISLSHSGIAYVEND